MENWNEMVSSLRNEILNTVADWIHIPSVKGNPEPGAPFGSEVRHALDTALSKAEEMGFRVRNIDGYAGDISMGPEGVNPLGILAHLDVVPVGDGWKYDPFGATIENGRIYGRGTSDDKGPAVAALYAMYIIKQSGISLNREVRLILGCDEESGWGCMRYYAEHCDMPKVGFSPDANFPVINTEKGSLFLKLHGKYCKNGIVREISVGERKNVIPGVATALLNGDAALCDKIAAAAAQMKADVTAEDLKDGTVRVTSIGIPGHAAYPESARNALGQMLSLLEKIGVEGPLGAIGKYIGTEYDGFSMGVRCSDEVSGGLTCNLGILRYNEQDGLYATLDIRFPILANHEALYQTIKATFGDALEVELASVTAPHHVSPHSPLVRCLLDAYNEVTGLPRECVATGGGTYAKVLEEGVAFGSVFPGEEDLAHQANEYMPIDSLMKNVEIIAHAIVKLQDF